jgi:hypothetical protein
MAWNVFNDGWFEYYYCSFCGHKQQLTIDKTPLPTICPKCKATQKEEVISMNENWLINEITRIRKALESIANSLNKETVKESKFTAYMEGRNNETQS